MRLKLDISQELYLKAKANRVELLIVREQNESDWKSDDGTPFIRDIYINIKAFSLARITSFNAQIDDSWVKENTDFDINNHKLQFDNQTFIDDIERSKKYSLLDLEKRLGIGTDADFGERSLKLTFREAFLHSGSTKLKIGAADITYTLPKPSEQPLHIDISKELVGVIEYLEKSSKTAFFKDRIIKNWGFST